MAIDHMGNVLTHSLGAATKIGHALAQSTQAHVRVHLLDALHSALIVAEEARQHMVDQPDKRATIEPEGSA